MKLPTNPPSLKRKLAMLAPFFGTWRAEAKTGIGPAMCTRTLTAVLGGHYVQMNAVWTHEKFKYTEIALFGVGAGGALVFWSFASDGKRSEGKLAKAKDLPPKAVAFEAQMPAGLARMIYAPEGDGFWWAVEAKTKKGWKRFSEHHYRPVDHDQTN